VQTAWSAIIFLDPVFIFFLTHLLYLRVVSNQQDAPGVSPSNTIMCTVGEFHHDENGEEAEEVPEDFSELSPEQQQVAILKRAFTLLAMGMFLVVLFSDPMVEVLQEVANRINVSPFYVSFVLAPLASNASEVIASVYYAGKKTRKTITVSMTTLEGVASMNYTFCLSILLGLIYFRGLVWAYTAETIATVLHIDAFIKKRKNYFFEITLHLSGM
jgi:Ca2+/Na+ antiporter